MEINKWSIAAVIIIVIVLLYLVKKLPKSVWQFFLFMLFMGGVVYIGYKLKEKIE